MITLTQDKNGQSIEIHIGEKFSISLDESPTSGYRWAVEPDNQGIVELTQSEFVPNSNTGIGGGGQHLFTFTGLKSGSASLSLKNWREWEGEKSVNARFSINVKVNSPVS